MSKIWIGAAIVAFLFVPHIKAEPPVAVLNAMQGIQDLELEEAPAAPAAEAPAVLDLDDLLGDPAPAAAAVAEEAQVVVEEAVEKVEEVAAAVVPEVADVVGTVAEAPAAAVETVDEVPAAVTEVAETPAGSIETVVGTVEAAPEVPGLPEGVARMVSEMEALERVRREAQDRHGLEALEQAEANMKVGNYEEAVRRYKDALDYIGDRPSNSIARREADDGLKEAYYRQSILLERRGNLKEAQSAAVQARLHGHPKGEARVLEIDDLINNPVPPPPPKVEKRWNEISYRENQKKINSLLNRAREYYATGEYDKCREQLELIMRDNPFNTEAINMLQRVGNKRFDVAINEAEATRREMIHEVKSVWTPRNYAKDLTDLGGRTDEARISTNAMVTSAGARIQRKMERIILPEVSFREANLTDVVNFLSDASREYDDPSTPESERGINFSLQRGSDPGGSAVAPSDDPFAPVADPGAGGGDGTPRITFSARYVPLKDVLDVIMNYAQMKYRIRGNIVMIMPENYPEGDLILNMYNVLPTIIERVATFSEERTGGGGRGDPWGMQQAEFSQQTNWKGFFGEFGVEWPDGSSVQHMPSIGKLVVKNTAENLAVLETVLAVINVTPKQVEIEARFVEVMQSDLESLGFEWLLNSDWQMLEKKADAALPPEGRRRIVARKGSFTSGFDYLSDTGLPGMGGDTVADNILTISSVLTNPELSMVLHVLSRRENTDLLSAPKVVTKNGSEATIKVVTEYIYPTEFNVEQPEISGGGTVSQNVMTMPAVEPGGFETREVGVILQVVPEVTPDGQMINLTLAPQVVSEPEWKDYGPVYPDGTRLPMEQPFFPVRSIATSIQIYNGATVVMGGMITEARQSGENKIPLLGDIPLLGRLFRYKFENSEKRNLLIFVTAKLVDPAGRVVRDRADIPMLPMVSEVMP